MPTKVGPKFKNIFEVKKKNMLSDAFSREEHDGIKIIHVASLDKKLLAKNCFAPPNGLPGSAYAQHNKNAILLTNQAF